LRSELSQLDGRVTQVDGRVTQVAAQTTDARKVADDGVRRSTAVNTRVSQAIADRNKREQVDVSSVQFGSGKYALLPEHKEALDKVYDLLAKNPTYTADVVGQADQQGGKKDNYMLSWRRTEHVRRYLAEK